MNRLRCALSPYLLQHADNPVHWQPWDSAALAQARREDKPILLSVGYAACHWCHVMARESFADAETAAQMNAGFVNIKIDREERPDLDRIYQAAHALFTRRSGGWPLTMFLTPAGEPFFGGTYFPPQARHGLPSFREVMTRVSEAWRDRRADIIAQNAHVLKTLQTLDNYPAAAETLTAAPLAAAAEAFAALFDDENGGLGGAPKFPHAPALAFCLHYALENNHSALLDKVRHALHKMAAGGLRDHLGGGFFRYCVDAGWHTPHFEKMLSDNGLLLGLYAEAGAALADDALLEAADATARWALNDMRDERGMFYASLDADSAGGEGAYYLWQEEELSSALAPGEYAVFASHYGIAAQPPAAAGMHLVRRQTLAQTAAAVNRPAEECRAQLAAAAAKLQLRRGERPPPATDDKILTAWNALMCSGLARRARLAADAALQAAARRAFDGLWQTLRIDGRTRAAARGGQISAGGFLDDCAFLLDAALELLRGDFCPEILRRAEALADELSAHYQDSAGGFFFTARDGETLIRRLKVFDDSATPCGNGVALRALLLLFQLTGEERRRQAAEAGLRLFYPAMREQPTSSASLLSALQCYLSPPAIVYLSGDPALCREWQQTLDKQAEPSLLVFCLPAEVSALPPPLQKPPPAAGACAYVCHNHSCQAPVTTLDALRALLEK